MKKTQLLVAMLLLSFTLMASNKPAIWIISDGCDNSLRNPKDSTKHLTDPDDISAIAAYLLMANHFDTRAIVVASNGGISTVPSAPNQGEWATEFFGKAYEEDIKVLNPEIGGYQPTIPFIESSIRYKWAHFNPEESYASLDEYPSIQALYDEVEGSDKVINIFCWGKLTEPAIFVKHCITNNRYDLLEKTTFISHWTASHFHVGTMEHPEAVHNCFNDADACAFLKLRAANGNIKYYECAAIGEAGLVKGGHKGMEYYNLFKKSRIGKIYVEGKYMPYNGLVDGSDAATFWVMLGNWGVSLHDINNNGTSTPEIEERNEKAFFENAKAMQDEMLRRAMTVGGYE